MGLLRKIAYAFLGFFLTVLALFALLVMLYLVLGPQNNVHFVSTAKGELALVKNEPAGLYYEGPATTAIAGWYCIESINSTVTGTPVDPECATPVGYSVQLNALLSNGKWAQNTMGTDRCSGACPGYSWGFGSEYWVGAEPVGAGGSPLNGPAQCAWLVITVVNGTVYVGFSTDGKNVQWYSKWYVGNATIVPDLKTNLVLAGPNCGEGINITEALVYLALYYWNGTTWTPAPVGIDWEGTGEWVQRAWVYTTKNACGVVSWPSLTNETLCPGAPGFSPYPG